MGRCSDYPYLRWEFKCFDENKILFELAGKRMTFRFVI
jgi:hypothetical protein